MKTHLAVYEEGIFDLRGGKTILREANSPYCPPPPQKETLMYVMYVYILIHIYMQNVQCTLPSPIRGGCSEQPVLEGRSDATLFL